MAEAQVIQLVFLVVIAVLSLGATFVLFRFLKSYARARQHKFPGGPTFEYGGALAGFVLIFLLLVWGMSSLKAAVLPTTRFALDGDWFLELTTQNGERRYGTARIRQVSGSPHFQVTGLVRSATTPPSVTFHTLDGLVQDRHQKIIFVYENIRQEMGIAVGNVHADQPDEFFVRYYDARSTDSNMDPEGRIDFHRTAFGPQLAQRAEGADDWHLGPTPGVEQPLESLGSDQLRELTAAWERVERAVDDVTASLEEGGVIPLEFRARWERYTQRERDYRQMVERLERFFTPQGQ